MTFMYIDIRSKISKITVKVINHFGDEVMKVLAV